jgi:hypothetical protein
MYERVNNKCDCDPRMCTSVDVLFDTNGAHKEHIVQNQNFSSPICDHVYCGEWSGGGLTAVPLGTLNMACMMIAQCRYMLHHDENHAVLLQFFRKYP